MQNIDKITFQTDPRTRQALIDALSGYGTGMAPSLSAIVREAVLAGLPIVIRRAARAARPRRRH